MTLHWLDYAVIVVYLLALLGAGLWFAKRAGRSGDDYFLGGRKLPWWALGASGMSSNLDVAGTMTIIALLYLYGLQGFWIEMRGGVVLPIAVFLAFMGKWHQRSKVVTTGEWMRLRFGDGWQGKAARSAAAGTYLVLSVLMVTFFLEAAGSFLAVYLPFSKTACAVGMAVVALTYTLLSGLYGVIWTDVFQAVLIGAAAIYVSLLAASYVSPELLAQWPGAAGNHAWPNFASGLTSPNPDTGDAMTSYAPFALFVVFWMGKGLLEGLGGSGGSAYMAQRFYAAKDEPTVARLCMLWTVLFAFRWPMVLGFVILAIHLGVGDQNATEILPAVLSSDLIPLGARGLLIAAIFAASMSTFDSTINAGASYAVRDLYVPLTRGRATERGQVWAGYVSSALIVSLGLGATLALRSAGGGNEVGEENKVLKVWVAIVVQFFPAFLVPFALRWFWARFTGLGFTLGVALGFAAAVVLALLPGEASKLGLPEHFGFLIQNNALTDVATLGLVGLCSTFGCLLGTFTAPPADRAVLHAFCQQIRPFGLWPKEMRTAAIRQESKQDVIRLVLAVTWQISTFLLPMTAMLRQWDAFGVLAVLWVATGIPLLRHAMKPAAV
ncbi:MAG: hypothetical protein AAF288_05700 [Planctomycetota bacterium]